MFKLTSSSLAILLFIGLFAAGCSTPPRDVPPNSSANREQTFMGIYTYKPRSYARVPETTFPISTQEIYGADNFSGNQTQLLWGLITITDY
jgi:hypothetical protein